MKTKKKAMAMSPAPTATIKIDGWWNHPERHGAMFDLAASEDMKLREGEVKVIPLGICMKLPEGYFGLVVPRSSTCLKHGILMANSVGVIEPDYCGDNDVWGFVAYAVRDTAIAKGTRIAQFMPVPMFGDLDFHVVESMPYTDRGGYGSTGEKSAEGEVMKKKAMLSQPMAGKTAEEIVAAREKAIADLDAIGYEVVNTYFTDEWYSDEAMEKRGVVQVPLCYLAKSLENMSLCHAAYFVKGWEDARGCRIEHDAAVAYGLEVLYED